MRLEPWGKGIQRDPRRDDRSALDVILDDRLFDMLWENISWHVRRALYLPIGSVP